MFNIQGVLNSHLGIRSQKLLKIIKVIFNGVDIGIATIKQKILSSYQQLRCHVREIITNY